MPTRRRFLGAASAAALSFHAVRSLAQDEEPTVCPVNGLKLPPALAALKTRQAEAVPISLGERERRLERARLLLVENKMQALVICTGTSLRYFTGLRWGQSERFFAWVLPVKVCAVRGVSGV